MCYLSVNLSDLFDQNPPHTFDKIVVKHMVPVKTLSKFHLEQNCQGHSKKTKDNKLWNKKQLMCQARYE